MVNVMVAKTGEMRFARDIDRGRQCARMNTTRVQSRVNLDSPTPVAPRGHQRESKRRATVETDEYKKPGRASRARALAHLVTRSLSDQPTAVGFRAGPPEVALAEILGLAASDTTRARPRLVRAVAFRVSITRTASSTICW